jgi:hypothetical protein
MSSAAQKKKTEVDSHGPSKPAKARLNADIPATELELVQKWAEADGVTLNSIVRQMIKYAEFIREIEADKSQKLLVEKNGSFERIVFK